jgi:ribonuclease I
MLLLLVLIIANAYICEAANITYDDLAIKKCDTVSQWSIHGFWPEYNQTNWPQYCDSKRYGDLTPAIVAPIRSLMEKYWYSCEQLDADNWSFWVHEWRKHGTCQPLPVLIYFRRTIDLFLDTQKKCYYGCCDKAAETSCLIHINKTTYTWTGKC